VVEIQRSHELGGSSDKSPKIGGSKSRVVRPREHHSRPSEEDRWQRSRSHELGGSLGRSPKVGCSNSRVVRPQEDHNRPSEEDRWQRYGDLMSSAVRRIRVPRLEVLIHEWRGHERIRAIHLKRTGGRDREDLANLRVRRVNAQVFGAKSRETRGRKAAKWREAVSRPS
jgi:hypothetical protein